MNPGVYNILLVNHAWLKPELESIGHKVVTAGYRSGFDICFSWSCSIENLYELLPEGFVPDRIVYYDDSANPSILNIEDALCPSVFLSVDIHHHYEWHKYFMDSFSHTLIAQKDYIQRLVNDKSETISVSWFPLWATQDIEPALVKDVPVSFRGTLDEKLHPGRKFFFNQVAEKVSFDFAEGPFSEVYARSGMVLNEAVNGDVNFRVFEGMIAGALMITPKVSNGLEELFTDGEDIVFYENRNVSDAVEKLQYFLSHEDERNRIAANGRAKVLELHSLKARAAQLSAVLDKVSGERVRLPVENKYFLYTHKMQVLWVYLRKYGFSKIQHSINELLTQIEALVLNDNSCTNNVDNAPIDDYLFTLDAINSDLLDEESYEYWIKLLSERFPEKEMVSFIRDSMEKADGQLKHPDKARRLKEGRSLMLNGFMKDL